MQTIYNKEQNKNLDLMAFNVVPGADDESKVYVLYLADCFQPPLYGYLADSLEDAINQFVEDNRSHCQDIDEDFPEDEIFYNDGGTKADITLLQVIECDLTDQPEDLIDEGLTDLQTGVISPHDDKLLSLVQYLINEGDLTMAGLLSEWQELPDKLTWDHYGLPVYEFENQEFALADQDETREAASEYIRQSVWAFNADFLAKQTDLPVEVFKVLQDKYEDANDPILRLIEKCGDMDEFCEDAIQTDKIGHFLSSYDGEEVELSNNISLFRLN